LINPSKVCGCYLVMLLNQTHVFDWHVIRRGSKSKHHNDTCLKEIGLRLQIINYSTLNGKHSWEDLCI
jgi:hypothetical protein